MADSVNVTLEPGLREAADTLFKSIGLTTQDAIRMFLRQAVAERRLPLSASADGFADLPAVVRLNKDESAQLLRLMENPPAMTAALEEGGELNKKIPSAVRPYSE